ncbi:MAG TPA: gluconate 2-dehydrogenase subunit 3 family protein [Terriglobia bacterium]|nr:gluconate 2-dehydrogenase subunit 3 family protein [Terriglobia bacterium]
MTSEPGNEPDRRRFLLSSLSGAGTAWITLNWPAVMAAAEHAAQAAKAAVPPQLEALTAEQAAAVEAIAARIIPTDDSPGAREAGVIYFIDRALTTFATESLADYQKGLPVFEAKTRELFPSVQRFSEAAPEQQDAVLKALDEQPFFELVRSHTVMGFLSDPMRGGNRDGVGWKLIGFDSSPAFTPPFGYYDRDYRGWQPPPKQEGKT